MEEGSRMRVENGGACLQQQRSDIRAVQVVAAVCDSGVRHAAVPASA